MTKESVKNKYVFDFLLNYLYSKTSNFPNSFYQLRKSLIENYKQI